MNKINGLIFLMLFIGAFGLVAGCADDGTDGADGGAGINGNNGTDGTDGTNGTNGSDGEVGNDGIDGIDGIDGTDATVGDIFHVADTLVEDITITITGVTIGTTSTIDFSVFDDLGRGGIGVTTDSGGDTRFAIAKLMLGTSGDLDTWQSYINRARANDAATNTVMQATYERTGTLEDFGDGTYTYTFEADLTTVVNPVDSTPIPFVASLTHRVAIQAGGNLPSIQVTHDFVPDGTTALVSHVVAMSDSCNECHGTMHMHGSRYEVKYCVMCHNPGTTDPENDESADMAYMTHKIHMGAQLTNGYELGGHIYDDLGYPQPEMHCRKCHSGADTDTPEGDNWQTKPTIDTCGACHDDVNFATGAGHTGGAATNNSGCAGCHGATAINGYHVTEDATPNNPDLPAGVMDITYELLSAAVDGSDVATIEFNMYADAVRLDMTALPAALTTEARYPSFLRPYAMDQNGVTSADWNNLGNSAGQPSSTSIGDLLAGTGGTITDDGTNATATITAAFPAGAYLRAVAIQGYFRQTMSPTAYVARHAPSAYIAVTGDDERREIVDNDKCLACHEILAMHGGNRVNNVMVCATCHLPNLSSSGRTSTATGGNAELIYGLDHQLYPEDTNNTRDMVHGLHAADMRNDPYIFVRIRSGNEYPFDWSHVTYPGELNDCTACHDGSTFEIPFDADALPTTVVTGGEPLADAAAVTAARATVPNDADIIVSPMSSSCYYCHDSAAATAHMEQNGGAIKWDRSYWLTTAPFETCEVCHGDGKMADVNLVHEL